CRTPRRPARRAPRRRAPPIVLCTSLSPLDGGAVRLLALRLRSRTRELLDGVDDHVDADVVDVVQVREQMRRRLYAVRVRLRRKRGVCPANRRKRLRTPVVELQLADEDAGADRVVRHEL